MNGRGKTTILSHITDAIYELAKKVFHNEFEGRENKYYRISSPLYNINTLEPSFVYLRFKHNDENIDYDMNYTFNKAQKRTVNAALSNTFGFGGHNACVILKKYVE